MISTALGRVINCLLVVVIVVGFWMLNYTHRWDRHDIGLFVKWSKAWDQSPREIYRLSDASYPIVGTLLSAGTVSAMRRMFPTHSDDDIVRDFKWIVLAVDAVNIVLVWRIFSALRIPQAATAALILYILPFGWTGAAVWGQIDSMTQSFLLSCLLAFLKIFEGAGSLLADSAYLAAGAAAFGLGLFCKQLFLFSTPCLIVGLWLCTRIIANRHGSPFVWSLGGPIGCLLIFGWLDWWPALPDDHRSHFAFLIFGPSTSYGDQTSIFGLNIWAIKPGGPFICPTCKWSGLAMYLAAMIYIFVVPFAFLRRQIKGSSLLFAMLVLVLGLSNLAFNVLLTGVHERYLFHTFPFLIIGGLVLRREGLMRDGYLVLTIAIGSLYGIYVWMVLNGPVHNWLNRSLRGGLILLLAALLCYSCLWLRGCVRALNRLRAGP
jgi:hypothetical protein